MAIVKRGSLACFVVVPREAPCGLSRCRPMPLHARANNTSSCCSAICGKFQIQLPLSILWAFFLLCRKEHCGSKVLIGELKQCHLLLKPRRWMEWAHVRWAGRWTLGQGRRGARRTDWRQGPRADGPQCLVTVPRGNAMPPFFPLPSIPMLHPRVNRLSHVQSSWFGWELRKKRQCLPSVV